MAMMSCGMRWGWSPCSWPNPIVPLNSSALPTNQPSKNGTAHTCPPSPDSSNPIPRAIPLERLKSQVSDSKLIPFNPYNVICNNINPQHKTQHNALPGSKGPFLSRLDLDWNCSVIHFFLLDAGWRHVAGCIPGKTLTFQQGNWVQAIGSLNP